MKITMHIWYQIKGPIIIFHSKSHAVNLKCFDYESLKKKQTKKTNRQTNKQTNKQNIFLKIFLKA